MKIELDQDWLFNKIKDLDEELFTTIIQNLILSTLGDRFSIENTEKLDYIIYNASVKAIGNVFKQITENNGKTASWLKEYIHEAFVECLEFNKNMMQEEVDELNCRIEKLELKIKKMEKK